jgi:hypothetical protein
MSITTIYWQVAASQKVEFRQRLETVQYEGPFDAQAIITWIERATGHDRYILEMAQRTLQDNQDARAIIVPNETVGQTETVYVLPSSFFSI